MSRPSGLLVKRTARVIEISSRPSVCEDWGVLFFALMLIVVAVAKPHQEGVLALMALVAGAVWWWCRPAITSRFKLDHQAIEVTWTSPAIETTASTYDWQQVLLLEAENNVITLRLLDGQRINLSYSHASSPAPKQVVREICDETGLRSIDTIVIPEPQDRPITFTGNGIGLSIEGPIAVLKGADPKRATTTVFNNMARQVLITDRSPVVYRGIDSIEVEQTNDEAATYGVFLNLGSGHRLAVIPGAQCEKYEVDFIVRQLSAFAGLTIQRAEDKPGRKEASCP